jgi:hypothetical protein
MAHSSSVLADKPAPPKSYEQVSSNEKYVFVMLCDWVDEKEDSGRELRQAYPMSGLYRNDKSKAPLWTVDWHADNVTVASDGIHLVRCGRSPLLRADRVPDLNEEAVSFLANGKLLRTYDVKDLVDSPDLLQRTASHYRWCEKCQFDDDRLQFTVSTHDGNRFVFDVQTGEIISSDRAWRVPVWIIVVSLCGIVILLLSIWWWLANPPSEPSPPA